VATDRNKPFVVHAGKYEVTAHGTKFNVEAYKEDSVFSASLIEGIVDVTAGDAGQPLRLRPRMMAVSNGDALTSDSIRNFDRYRWREGLICFKDTHFREIMNSFEKFYGVKIIIDNRKVLTYKCTSKFRLNEGVEYALHVLQRDVRFRFQRDEEAKIIYIK
jgi:ferric-dicitrate binding protein FerR (iron transport regulator)